VADFPSPGRAPPGTLTRLAVAFIVTRNEDLVLGSGGREHALVWKLQQSPSVESVCCAPGNGGISADAECFPAQLDDADSLVSLAQSLHADITVVGPEVPLVCGVADAFASRGLRLVGPSKRGAELGRK